MTAKTSIIVTSNQLYCCSTHIDELASNKKNGIFYTRELLHCYHFDRCVCVCHFRVSRQMEHYGCYTVFHYCRRVINAFGCNFTLFSLSFSAFSIHCCLMCNEHNASSTQRDIANDVLFNECEYSN